MTSRSSCPACSGSGTVRGLNGPGSSGPCYACAETPEPLLLQATEAHVALDAALTAKG